MSLFNRNCATFAFMKNMPFELIKGRETWKTQQCMEQVGEGKNKIGVYGLRAFVPTLGLRQRKKENLKEKRLQSLPSLHPNTAACIQGSPLKSTGWKRTYRYGRVVLTSLKATEVESVLPDNR